MAKHENNTIHIDGKQYKISAGFLTGAQLRQVPEPDITDAHDLYLEGHGKDEDELIDGSKSVQLKAGMHFFTAPSTINPG